MTEPDAVPDQAPAWFGPAIDQHISNALGKLFDSGKADVADDAEQPAKTPPKGRPADVDVEGQVADAQDFVEKIKRQVRAETTAEQEAEAHKAEHDRLRSLEEKQPQQIRKVTRAMWGDQ